MYNLCLNVKTMLAEPTGCGETHHQKGSSNRTWNIWTCTESETAEGYQRH